MNSLIDCHSLKYIGRSWKPMINIIVTIVATILNKIVVVVTNPQINNYYCCYNKYKNIS